MSRIAQTPINIPSGVEVQIKEQAITVKGKLGQMNVVLHDLVSINQDNDVLTFSINTGRDSKLEKLAWAQAGTARSHVNNCILGVHQGFEKKLKLVGVGYRARIKDRTLDLQLGYSHVITYSVPAGIAVTTPSQTEIVVSGFDKQKVGQVAAEIRAYRKPEPYKGKGVRYADEQIFRKEAKKKS